jgi:hypothetical protein
MLGTIARNIHAFAQELLADVESSRARAASERERADELALQLQVSTMRSISQHLAALVPLITSWLVPDFI